MNEPSKGSVPPPVRLRRSLRYTLPVALVLSLGLHAAVVATLNSMAALPDSEFEFAIPDEIEFGMTEAMEAVMVNAPVVPVEVEDGTDGTGDGDGDGPGTEASQDAGVASTDAGVAAGLDGGVPTVDGGDEQREALDGGVPEQVADAGVDAGVDAGPPVVRLPVANATIRGPARIPAGAQLALRLDMGRLRQSVVANDVRALIAAVPDWQELLGGSGIDPLNDLERVLIATPNMRRSRIMVAGRHVHDGAFTRAAVERMATAHGASSSWSTQEGVQVAPWANDGNTPRVLAMLSEHHFTISRAEDLAVALAMTQARAARDAEGEGLEDAEGPDVLLSMGPNEGLSLEVEGVHAFLQTGNPDVIPLRGRLAIREVGPRIVAIDGLAVFPSEQAATDAIAYWTRQRDAALQSFAVRMVLGNRVSVLQSFTFTAEGERVMIRGRATADDVRYGLDLARRQFEAWALEAERRRAAAAGGDPASGMAPAPAPAP